MLTEEQRNKLHIPSREEFHRLDAGLIIESDYEGHPNNSLKQIIKSWSFDKDYARYAASRDRRYN